MWLPRLSRNRQSPSVLPAAVAVIAEADGVVEARPAEAGAVVVRPAVAQEEAGDVKAKGYRLKAKG